MYGLNGRDVEKGMLVLVVDQEGLRAKRRCRQQRANRLYFIFFVETARAAFKSFVSPRYFFKFSRLFKMIRVVR